MKKYKNKIILAVSCLFVITLSLCFNMKINYSHDLQKAQHIRKYYIFNFLIHKKISNIKKLKTIISKYKIKNAPIFNLGTNEYSLWNLREYKCLNSDRINILRYLYLIDESTKISHTKKERYIKMIIEPLKHNNIDKYLENLYKIINLYSYDKI